jgi:hypothetical protein
MRRLLLGMLLFVLLGAVGCGGSTDEVVGTPRGRPMMKPGDVKKPGAAPRPGNVPP